MAGLHCNKLNIIFVVCLAPMLRRQERHNEGTLTALMSTESLVQQDGCDNHTREGKPAHAYNITQCRRHCLLALNILRFMPKGTTNTEWF